MSLHLDTPASFWLRLVRLALLFFAAVHGAALALTYEEHIKLTKLTPEILAGYSLSSPELRFVYENLFTMSGGKPQAWKIAVGNDLLRRGKEAEPLLLSIFREHPNDEERGDILFGIEDCPSISLEPFLAAIREIWAREGLTIHPRACASIARFIASHGSAADKTILEAMLQHPDPQARSKVDLVYMQKRLDGVLKPTEWHGGATRVPAGYNWVPDPTTGMPKVRKSASPPAAPETDKTFPSEGATSKQIKPPLAIATSPATAPAATPAESQWKLWLAVVITATAAAAWLGLKKK